MTLKSTRFLPTAFAAAIVAAVSTVAVVAQPQAAEAACVTFDGTTCRVDFQGATYGITTVTGTFNDLSTTLTSTIWWNNRDTADAFALLVGDAFGFPNFFGSTGPSFAYALNFDVEMAVDRVYFREWAPSFPQNQGGVGGSSEVGGVVRTYAIATLMSPNTPSVPTLTLLPALVGLGLAAYRKRKAALSAKS